MSFRFRDRRQAGRVLAAELLQYAGQPGTIVFGVPRGGVVVAYEVAQALGAELDVLLVRKLGVPGQEELAMGAIASGGIPLLNGELIRELGITQDELAPVVAGAKSELERRERLYRGDRPESDLTAKTAIVVDDGLATGSTIFAAIAALRRRRPAEIVVAVPVAAPETISDVSAVADRVVCGYVPRALDGVGRWYENFRQVEDDEVRALLEDARRRHSSGSPPEGGS